MVELLESVKSGRDCPRRAPHAAAQLSMGVAGPQGRERATREAIDSKTGVIPCAETASPPPFFFSVVTVSTSRHEALLKRKSRTPSRSRRPGRLSVVALGIARHVTADWWDGVPATHPRLRSNPRQPIRYRRHDTSAVLLDVLLGDVPRRVNDGVKPRDFGGGARF